MTGDAPQPGETPRDDGTPWSPADPTSPWWPAGTPDAGADRPRDPHRRAATGAAAATPTLDPPQPARHSSEAARAHRAGAEHVAAALTGEPAPSTRTAEPAPPGPAQTRPAPTLPAKTLLDSEPGQAPPAEHDHDRVDAERFNTRGTGTVYAARARPAAEPGRVPGTGAEPDAGPAEPARAEADPDVMVLPEPDRTRPTVALDRPVPGQPPSGLSRLGRARDSARADRALQDRVRQERAAALLETSPFWKAEEERRAGSALAAETRELTAPVRRRARRRAPEPRRPAAGLLGLLALGLIAAFFAWVSAEPFWLAVGHGDRGSATVARCTGSGVTQRCTGRFIAADGGYQVDRLALFGVEAGQRAPGTSSPARMVSSQSRQAYVGSTGVLVHLRWALSFILVLLCGLGIAVLTGARRLETVRARRGALLLSLAGPLALLAGFLTVTY
ncbi:hypothetical protein GCM10020358_06060 [Amorphoplanes nipponensis]|uniref:Uncharacterized protein n=1 Tax=Actinoplanes nipponensis TaxID=135950 RepID=A0A919MQ59_9ACTN|nr:hypothetical protein [Actinoplanes nipponensis]GIE50208.1 hypothetical protein Ani05nite_37420 [Actinoplanes nipponensis]